MSYNVSSGTLNPATAAIAAHPTASICHFFANPSYTRLLVLTAFMDCLSDALCSLVLVGD